MSSMLVHHSFMPDKLNGILVKHTVIELLQSYLAGWPSVAAQKKLNFAHPPVNTWQGSACKGLRPRARYGL